MSVDPLAAKYPGWSPYNYVRCNPLRLIDPDGMGDDDSNPANALKTLADLWHKFTGVFNSKSNNDESNNKNSTSDDPSQSESIQDVKTVANAEEAAKETVKESPRIITEETAKLADKTTEVSTDVAVGGVVTAPFTEGASLEVSAVALTTATISSAVSLGAKTVDALAFGGSKEAVKDQAAKVFINITGGKIAGAFGNNVSKILLKTAIRSSTTYDK